MQIRKTVNDIYDELISVRRALHRIPELSHEEIKTQQFIMDYLRTNAMPDELIAIADTGVKAVYYAPNATRTTALRADMDALPVAESTNAAYASQHEGKMHACGHDAHMAIALLFAKLAKQNQSSLRENLVILFQPAEEGGNGAEKMIECGALEAPHVDRIFGLHVFPSVPLGRIGIRKGAFFARATGFDIVLRGKKAHGATPQNGTDAIVAAGQLITMMQSIVSRSIDPLESVALTIGSIHGGEKRNIICDEVTLQCTLRTFSETAFNTAIERTHAMLDALTGAFGVQCSFTLAQDYYGVMNSAALADELAYAVGDAATDIEKQTLGEDFSYYQRKTEGMFFALGLGDGPPLHSDNFSFNEHAMLYALEAYARLIDINI